MKVNIYLNDERIENEDVKKYKCVSGRERRGKRGVLQISRRTGKVARR